MGKVEEMTKPSAASTGKAKEDRIKITYRKTSSLHEYAKNPRDNESVVEKMVNSIDEFGFRIPILIKPDGEVIDGHLRFKAALAMDMDEVPVIVTDTLTEDQVKAFRLLANRSVNWADWNQDQLAAEMRELMEADYDLSNTGFSDNEIKQLTSFEVVDYKDVDIEGTCEDIADELNPKNQVFQIKDDTLFSSNNKLDIPDLMEEMLGGEDCIPTYTWDMHAEIDPEKVGLFVWRKHPVTGVAGQVASGIQYGILVYYVEDFNFEQVWERPSDYIAKFRAYAPMAFVTPDFSLFGDQPYVFQAYQHYRARWVGRYWQENGYKVIPNLTWTTEKCYDLSVMGIPVGAPVVSCQCRTSGNDDFGKAFFLKGLNYCLNEIKPKNCLIYGGYNHRHWIEKNIENKECKIHFYESITHIRARKYHSKGIKGKNRDEETRKG